MPLSNCGNGERRTRHCAYSYHFVIAVWRAKRGESAGEILGTGCRDQAIGYAETRARLRTGEIRIFDSTGNVERVIAFDDANRRL